jgi:putative phosphoesterase
MKIIVSSDIHGSYYSLEQLALKVKPYDYWLDAGDFCLSTNYLLEFDILTVKGNNDFFTKSHLEEELEIAGLKILLVHGHHDNVKLGLSSILQRAKSLGVDLVIYGHTHVQSLKVLEGITLLNPGSLGFNDEYAIINDKKIELCSLKK